MVTLADVTEGHSRRISQISQRRDARLHDAADARDRHLRALPATAKLYAAFDKQVGDARATQGASDGKAESARAAALQKVSDALRDALDKAHTVRRDADQAAFAKRRKAEEQAEQDFMIAIAGAGAKPSTQAQKIRADAMARAKADFDEALAAAQEQFRQSRDAALVAESQGTRDANRAFGAAATISETSAKSARAMAEQALAKALARVPDAAQELTEWRKTTATIVADYRREESEEFERFHREMEALR